MKVLSSLLGRRVPLEALEVLGVKAGGGLAGAFLVKKLEIDCCFLVEACEDVCELTMTPTVLLGKVLNIVIVTAWWSTALIREKEQRSARKVLFAFELHVVMLASWDL